MVQVPLVQDLGFTILKLLGYMGSLGQLVQLGGQLVDILVGQLAQLDILVGQLVGSMG